MIEEGERLGRVLGDKAVLFMCHHGTLVVADSVHVAFDEVGHVSRVARVGRDAVRWPGLLSGARLHDAAARHGRGGPRGAAADAGRGAGGDQADRGGGQRRDPGRVRSQALLLQVEQVPRPGERCIPLTNK